jgi:hypothetical protein
MTPQLFLIAGVILLVIGIPLLKKTNKIDFISGIVVTFIGGSMFLFGLFFLYLIQRISLHPGVP